MTRRLPRQNSIACDQRLALALAQRKETEEEEGAPRGEASEFNEREGTEEEKHETNFTSILFTYTCPTAHVFRITFPSPRTAAVKFSKIGNRNCRCEWRAAVFFCFPFAQNVASFVALETTCSAAALSALARVLSESKTILRCSLGSNETRSSLTHPLQLFLLPILRLSNKDRIIHGSIGVVSGRFRRNPLECKYLNILLFVARVRRGSLKMSNR